MISAPLNSILAVLALASLVYGLEPGVACWDNTDGPAQCGLGQSQNEWVMNTIYGEVLEGLPQFLSGSDNFPNNQPIVCVKATGGSSQTYNCLSLQNSGGAPYKTIESLTQTLGIQCAGATSAGTACGGIALFQPQGDDNWGAGSLVIQPGTANGQDWKCDNGGTECVFDVNGVDQGALF